MIIELSSQKEIDRFAFSIGTDAGERSRRKAGRKAWNEEDLAAAIAASQEFRSKLGLRGLRVSDDLGPTNS